MVTITNNIINTYTLNINGLLDNFCQYSLKNIAYKIRLIFSFLQETHVSKCKIANKLNAYLICINVSTYFYFLFFRY